MHRTGIIESIPGIIIGINNVKVKLNLVKRIKRKRNKKVRRMFKLKPQRAAYYRKNGAAYLVEIEGMNDEEEARIVKNFIKNLSINRRVFVEISGDTSAIDKKAVLRMEIDPKYQFCTKMEILPEKIEDIDILKLQENMWTHFYFVRSSINWKEFIEMKKINILFKQGDLEATIYLYNLDGIKIEIGEHYSHHMKELFGQLQKEDYVLKKR